MSFDMVSEETPPAIDMGYEEHVPARRRGSMSEDEERERRASIKAIMADNTISPMAKRKSIQHLMDGRRNSLENGRRNSLENGAGRRASLDHARRRGSTANSSVVSAHSRRSSIGGNSSTGETDPVDMGYGECDDEGPVDMNNSNSFRVEMPEGFVISNELTRRTEQARPFCSHYERNCTIISPCCGAAFGCRICHDDCPVLPPKINNGGKQYRRSASLPSSFTSMDDGTPGAGQGSGLTDPEEDHHNIDRFAIREVICRQCYTRQSSKANNCVCCGVRFGAYHCIICNLWMSNDESPYHCPDCGFCRVGGADNFKHCNDCGMCIDRSLYDNHNCKAGKYRSNCPVCQEFLFSSRSASHEMPCGHAIHWACFKQLAAHDSRCPVCKKTAETRERMLPTWNAMAAGVALQPVPKELCRLVNITCNDCEKGEQNRAWHFLGVQCTNCQSFNTIVDQLVLAGEEAYEFIERQRQLQEAGRDGTPRPRRRVNRRRSAF